MSKNVKASAEQYIIIRRSDAEKYLDQASMDDLERTWKHVELGRTKEGLSPLQGIFVEADDPAYEAVWRMLDDMRR